MLTAQNSLPVLESENTEESSENQYKDINEFLYGQTEVPFISFLKTAFLEGMFKNLGDIKELKEKNPTYSSYIDRWLAESIRLKLITVLSEGEIQLNFDISEYSFNSRYEKNRPTARISTDVLQKISTLAKKQLSSTQKNLYPSANYFVVKNEPSLLKEVGKIYQEFLAKMNQITEKSNKQRSNEPTSKLHYFGITSCSLTKEVFSEI